MPTRRISGLRFPIDAGMPPFVEVISSDDFYKQKGGYRLSSLWLHFLFKELGSDKLKEFFLSSRIELFFSGAKQRECRTGSRTGEKQEGSPVRVRFEIWENQRKPLIPLVPEGGVEPPRVLPPARF